MDNPSLKYAPAGGRVYGPDGKVYWLVDLLRLESKGLLEEGSPILFMTLIRMSLCLK